jgi:hypothetical protein
VRGGGPPPPPHPPPGRQGPCGAAARVHVGIYPMLPAVPANSTVGAL